MFCQTAKKLLDFLFSDFFHLLWNIPKKAKELGVGRKQFHAGVNRFILFIVYNITLS